MLVAGIWHSIERWGELAELCPEYGVVSELDNMQVMVTNGEDYHLAGIYSDLRKPADELRVASAFAYSECPNCGPDTTLHVMAQSRGGFDRRRRNDRQDVQADPDVIELLWKHTADDAPTHFMLVRAPEPPA
jgi:hypothetical protein